jgi:hypothetical protein
MMINFNLDSFLKKEKNIDCKKLGLSAAIALACLLYWYYHHIPAASIPIAPKIATIM